MLSCTQRDKWRDFQGHRYIQHATVWFQQDDTISDTAQMSMKKLSEMCLHCLISWFHNLNQLSRSPDFSTPNYFTQGYLNRQVSEMCLPLWMNSRPVVNGICIKLNYQNFCYILICQFILFPQ